jgi:Domain of unknown function (DUF6378)
MTERMNPRSDLLHEVIDERVQVYGRPVDTFPRVAQIWSGILGFEVSAADVTLCLIGYKLLRTQVTPDYSDNSNDIEGYLDIFRQIQGKDMVHARSVEEYVAEKSARQFGPRSEGDH